MNSEGYHDLFQQIGTSWGGDGAPNFYLPDLRGAFLRGVDNGKTARYDLEREKRVAPRQDANPNNGNSGINVGSMQAFSTAKPSGDPFKTNVAGEHSHGGIIGQGPGPHDHGGEVLSPDLAIAMPVAGNHEHTITAGGDQETRPVNAYVYYIIRVK
ncbi:hypothetical protein GCM10028824_17930 [Hymenobacter segetis]